jgi:hypothetical protein
MDDNKLTIDEENKVKSILSKIVVIDCYGKEINEKIITTSEPKFFRKIFLRYLRMHGNILEYKGYQYNLELIMNDMILNRISNISTKLKYQVRREDKSDNISYCSENDFLSLKESWSNKKLVDIKDIKIKLIKPKNVSDKIWNGSNDEQKLFLIKLFGGILDSTNEEGYKKDSETNKILCDLHIEGFDKKILATDRVEYKYKNKKFKINLCEICFNHIQETDVAIVDFYRLNVS